MKNKDIHRDKVSLMKREGIGAVKELDKNIIVIWYKFKMFRIFDIRSNTILWEYTKSENNKNPFKYGYYGYQNAIAIGRNQILFIESNKDDKSTVYQLEKSIPPYKTQITAEKSRISLTKRIKISTFLSLEQMVDIFPSEWTWVTKNQEIISGTKFGRLKWFAFQ